LVSIGETELSAVFVRNFDASSNNEDGTSFGAFWVQDVDNWSKQFYAGYRYYDLDRQAIDTKPIHMPVLGTLKRF
jgi:hypothetical protein